MIIVFFGNLEKVLFFFNEILLLMIISRCLLSILYLYLFNGLFNK